MRDRVPLSTMLHIGGGGTHRAGFTAVDGRPDALADEGYPLHFVDDSLVAIYLDRVLEQLDLADGVRLLLPLPHQPVPIEIRLSWRGPPERFLPGPVAPLALQVTGMELTLAPAVAPAPGGPSGVAGGPRP